jgi:agmatine deiminase
VWLADLKQAEREVAEFAAAVHADGHGEEVRLVAAHEDAAAAAQGSRHLPK